MISPSIRSKLDQKLRYGFSLKMVAREAITTNTNNVKLIQLRRGLKPLVSNNRPMSQATEIISTMKRKVQFLPVINGKKRLLDTYKGIKRTANKPAIVTQRNILLIFIVQNIA